MISIILKLCVGSEIGGVYMLYYCINLLVHIKESTCLCMSCLCILSKLLYMSLDPHM